MLGRKICSFEKMWIIIPKFFLLFLLIWSIVNAEQKYDFGILIIMQPDEFR